MTRSSTSIRRILGNETFFSGHPWQDPFLAHGLTDLDTVSFRYLVEYLGAYDRGRRERDPDPDYPLPYPLLGLKEPYETYCVRINCMGEPANLGRIEFERNVVDSEHPMFDSAPIPLSVAVDVPLVIWRLPRYRRGIPLNNKYATALMRGIDPDEEPDQGSRGRGWGMSPRQWREEVGDVIVARKDRMFLIPGHIEALCKYCHEEKGGYLEVTQRAWRTQRLKCLNGINEDSFESFSFG
ncbi:hypothetical protein BDY21DRAFT_334766 [Lineolata rhizophorae]|uniref:Uncharacterized protein n=1 Tax=Lineolata rhizophorae TaxID=578093 RepID=A0A6A6P8T1_9PEZI|nr:hypothetical protein BDY21DRAFT_334766 [Lineolata rhizophorae]